MRIERRALLKRLAGLATAAVVADHAPVAPNQTRASEYADRLFRNGIVSPGEVRTLEEMPTLHVRFTQHVKTVHIVNGKRIV